MNGNLIVLTLSQIFSFTAAPVTVFLSGIKAVNIAVSSILCSCFLKLVLPSIITGYDSLVFLGMSVFLIYWFKAPIWGIVILLGAVGYGFGMISG